MKTIIMNERSMLIIVGVCIIASVSVASQVYAMNILEQLDSNPSLASSSVKPPMTLAVVENPELVAHVLDSLLRSIVLSSSVDFQSISSSNGAQKRGLDLGISRGFSGSQAGKHLMGLSAASFANGPGRK